MQMRVEHWENTDKNKQSHVVLVRDVSKFIFVTEI